jgi:hypothetical protein
MLGIKVVRQHSEVIDLSIFVILDDIFIFFAWVDLCDIAHSPKIYCTKVLQLICTHYYND